MLKIKYRNQKKYVLILLVFHIAFFSIFFTDRISSDGIFYFANTHSMLFDNDLDLTNELEVRPYYRFNTDFKTVTGLAHGIQNIGSSLLNIPFVLVAHAISSINNYPQDGYSKIYDAFFNLGSVVYSFFGNLFLFYALSRRYTNNVSFFATLLIFFSSSVVHYSFFESSMSHAHSYFASSLLVYFFLRFREINSNKYWILMGSITGLTVLIRITSIVFILLPILDLIFFKRQKTKKKLIINFACYVAFFIIVFSPQMIYWDFLYDELIPIPHPIEQYYEQAIEANELYTLSGEEEPRTKFIDLTNPYVLEFLFSENRGLFVWHPVYLFAIAGTYFLLRDNRLGLIIVILTGLIFYLHASAWDAAIGAGASFGQRRITDITPFLAIGLAHLFERWKQWKYEEVSKGFVISFLMFWNFYFMMVYIWERLVRERFDFSFNEMVINNISNLPIYLENQISEILKSILP